MNLCSHCQTSIGLLLCHEFHLCMDPSTTKHSEERSKLRNSVHQYLNCDNIS